MKQNRYFLFLIAFISLLFLSVSAVFGSDLIAVSRINNLSTALLTDNNTETGTVINAKESVIYRQSKDEIIALKLHITSSSPFAATVNCDDVMPLQIAFETGSKWYYLRLPYSHSNQILITWSKTGERLNEVQLIGKTHLPAPVKSTSESISVSIGKDVSPSSDVMGFMCNWFERGIADGITKQDTSEEFVKKFKECSVTSLRYPGGTMTYGYPETSEAVPAFKKAFNNPEYSGLKSVYGLSGDTFGWAGIEDYFRFCKRAGLTAWYEINPGYWYDPSTDQVRKIIAMDSTHFGQKPDKYTDNYIDQAVQSAINNVKLAKKIGIKAVWEIGNEDYCYYTPATYAKLCAAFIKGIRSVDPNARVAVCGDGYDWSDESFGNAFPNELKKAGLDDITYSSEHFYMYGVGDWIDGNWYPRPSDTPVHVGDAIIKSWPTMKNTYMKGPERFRNAGVNVNKVAITEWNYTAGSMPIEIEHSVGRALGEAYSLCELINDGVSVFFHDMVRSGPISTFFCRLDYYPDNPVGCRYHWFPEGAASSVVLPHANGKVVYNQNGICISRHRGYAYITIINREPISRICKISFTDAGIDSSKKVEKRTFKAGSPDCFAFDYYLTRTSASVPGNEKSIQIESAPFSVVGYRVGLR